MEKLVALCQQLQMGAKTPVQGKTATFQKVTTLRLCVPALLLCVCAYKMYGWHVWMDLVSLPTYTVYLHSLDGDVFCGSSRN